MIRRLAIQVLVLVVAAAVLAAGTNALRSDGIAWGGHDPERYRYPDVDFLPVEAAAHLHDQVTTLFLDARPSTEFTRRHVAGAVSFPADSVQAKWESLRDFVDPQMTLVVYGDDIVLEVRAAKFLGERGCKAQVLDGGWQAWSAHRLPVE